MKKGLVNNEKATAGIKRFRRFKSIKVTETL